MAFLILVSLLAGAASFLTPCVLPLLPGILAASSTNGGRRRSWGIVVGIVVTFALSVLALGELVSALGLPADTLRWISVVILGIFGLILVVPPLERRFQRLAQVVVRHAPRASGERDGFGGGLAVGAGLGLVWTPCAGPLFAAVVAGAASRVHLDDRIAITVAYSLGMVVPLVVLVFGGRAAGRRLMHVTRGGSRVLPVMGVILLGTAAIVATNAETNINTWVSQHAHWSSTPLAGLQSHALSASKGHLHETTDTSLAVADATTSDPVSDSHSNERIDVSQQELSQFGYPQTEVLRNYGPAPDFAGISHWFNTPGGKALRIGDLKGKVVLVDFWTYSCINCLRAIPHVEALYKKYASQGLVVVGVHTPEFDFEKDAGNVGHAIKQIGVTYPVALDPDDATWANYYNEYWPATYLIDRQGDIRAVHYGEGSYDRDEQLVRALLGDTGGSDEAQMPDTTPTELTSPETYVGYARTENGISTAVGHAQSGIVANAPARYTLPAGVAAGHGLAADAWGFSGVWTDRSEDATAGTSAKIVYHYQGKHVYMVLGPPPSGAGTVTVTDGRTSHRIAVSAHQLYPIWNDTGSGSGQLAISFTPGIQVFTFTFG